MAFLFVLTKEKSLGLGLFRVLPPHNKRGERNYHLTNAHMSPRRENSGSTLQEFKGIVSVEEYRKLLGDFATPDERAAQQIEFITSFCRENIRGELQKLYENQHIRKCL